MYVFRVKKGTVSINGISLPDTDYVYLTKERDSPPGSIDVNKAYKASFTQEFTVNKYYEAHLTLLKRDLSLTLISSKCPTNLFDLYKDFVRGKLSRFIVKKTASFQGVSLNVGNIVKISKNGSLPGIESGITFSVGGRGGFSSSFYKLAELIGDGSLQEHDEQDEPVKALKNRFASGDIVLSENFKTSDGHLKALRVGGYTSNSCVKLSSCYDGSKHVAAEKELISWRDYLSSHNLLGDVTLHKSSSFYYQCEGKKGKIVDISFGSKEVWFRISWERGSSNTYPIYDIKPYETLEKESTSSLSPPEFYPLGEMIYIPSLNLSGYVDSHTPTLHEVITFVDGKKHHYTYGQLKKWSDLNTSEREKCQRYEKEIRGASERIVTRGGFPRMHFPPPPPEFLGTAGHIDPSLYRGAVDPFKVTPGVEPVRDAHKFYTDHSEKFFEHPKTPKECFKKKGMQVKSEDFLKPVTFSKKKKSKKLIN